MFLSLDEHERDDAWMYNIKCTASASASGGCGQRASPHKVCSAAPLLGPCLGAIPGMSMRRHLSHGLGVGLLSNDLGIDVPVGQARASSGTDQGTSTSVGQLEG